MAQIDQQVTAEIDSTADKKASNAERVRIAAEAIRKACENPEKLVVDLASLVKRKKRKGVISDNWSYRNQMLVLLRGYSQARGSQQWEKIGRLVQGDPMFIVCPCFAKVSKPLATGTVKSTTKKEFKGFRPIPVYGLEQTVPADEYVLVENYHPFVEPEDYGFIQIKDGKKVKWWKWFKQLQSKVDDNLTGILGAAIVAKCLDDETEFDDVLRQLKKETPADIAKRIEESCRAALNYLTDAIN